MTDAIAGFIAVIAVSCFAAAAVLGCFAVAEAIIRFFEGRE